MQANLVDKPELRNRHQVYADRKDGGACLASMLISYKEQPEAIVLAIPSGGVPVGLEIQHRLAIPMDLLITRKLQIPGNTEAGFGAMTLGGQVFYNKELLARLHLTKDEIAQEKKKVHQELERRNKLYRQSRNLPDLAGFTAILVDDGLASGFTMMAALAMVRELQAAKVIVAIPTAPLSSIQRIGDEVDEIYCPHIQDYGSFAVAAAYRNWRDLDAREVVAMLNQLKRE
ncbi:MAG: phosphoribosyltransferase family protein [Desulfocapsaceae bacterium]|nr:phosphoribosyltransferase family protein [Desulfocapsaceae bacterium]